VMDTINTASAGRRPQKARAGVALSYY
jgi:hypothetical protein